MMLLICLFDVSGRPEGQGTCRGVGNSDTKTYPVRRNKLYVKLDLEGFY